MWLRAAVAAAMVVLAAAEEEAKVSQTSLAVCLMLMGTVGSTMGAFYLVNHSDKDIKTSTWKIICNTISIFAAVLLFQAVNGMVTYIFLDGATLMMKVIVSFVHSATWFAVLQVFLALVSRAVPSPSFLLKPMPAEEGTEREDVMDCIRLDMKCWGILFGHIAGFASINAWCVVQQFFHRSLIGSLLVIVGAAITLWLTFLITDMCREHIAMADDGEKDACEELWDDSVEETEEDVRALTLSFLTVQWLRFAIFGVLPSAEGDLPDRPYSQSQITSMLCVALFAVFYNNIPGRWCFKQRIVGKSEAMRNILNLVFAWGVMYSFRVWLLTEKYLHGDASGEVMQATIITWGTFAAQHILDYFADMEATGKETDAAIRSLISTLGVLVGFSWEKCFDVAVDNIAEKIESVPPELTKLALALVLASSVLPAWRWYILPVLDRLGGFEEEGEEDEEEECEDPKAIEGYKPPALPDATKEVSRAVQPLAAAPPPAPAVSEAEVLALRKQVQDFGEMHKGSAREIENLQQQLRGAAQLKEQQEARIGAALQAEQDQRTRVYQLEAEKSQIQAQLNEVGSQLDMVMRNKASEADNGQLNARISELQAKFEVAVKGQAACQAENSQLNLQIKDLKNQVEMARGGEATYQAEKAQFEGRIAEMTAQLEGAVRTKDAGAGEQGMRVRELEQQLQAASTAQSGRIHELEAQVLADAERKASLEALVESLNKNVEDLRAQAQRYDPTANDELIRTIAGPPVQPGGSSLDVPAAMPPPTQTSQPREPVNVPSLAQRSLGSSGVTVPNAAAPPQLLSSTRSSPNSPGSARPKGQPVSPTGARVVSPGGPKAAPVSPPSGGSAGGRGGSAAGQPPGGEAPNRKTPALQPGQAPTAPRLSTSDPQMQRNGSNPTVAQQRVILPSTSSRGSSSKEAVFPITQPQPQRLASGGLGRR